MQTELQRLLSQIEQEYDAAYRGMNAFSDGAARHSFINARMSNIDKCRKELVDLVGENEAFKLLLQENDKGEGHENRVNHHDYIHQG
ncbi:MAG: hypothetical protein ACJ8CB_35410 [Ktedonobacteraceae bacterium]